MSNNNSYLPSEIANNIENNVKEEVFTENNEFNLMMADPLNCFNENNYKATYNTQIKK